MAVEKRNPFNASGDEGEATGNTTDALYGKAAGVPVASGRLVAAPKPIRQIWPDLRQPRRAIPVSVRGYWIGDPDELPDLLRHWQVMAEKEHGEKIDIIKVLKGYSSLATDNDDGIYSGFAKLCALASAIYNEGLTNPITVIANGSQWKVETGERRWLAHHLLAMHMDEKYSTIAAREVQYDPFRQASENNARDGYNAIEMARQIALLIMEARTGLDGVKYDAFEDMVLAGECDRKFYAQVANGNIHRIPPGVGGKISNATGLSEARISQYRRLLAPTEDDALNDQIWIDADANAWTENYIREHVQTLTAVKVNPDNETLTTVKVPPADGVTPDNPHSAAQSGNAATPLSEYYDAPPKTPYDKWTPRDAFGNPVYPEKPSPFGSSAPAKPKQDDGAVRGNLQNKKVRLKDGREGMIWEDKGGEKLMFLKQGATISNEVYRSAVWVVLEDAAQAEEIHGWRVGNKVLFMRDGENVTGVVTELHETVLRVELPNGGVANVPYERAAHIGDNPSPATNWPPQSSPNPALSNPVKPNAKLVDNRTLYTVLTQAKYMAESLESSEAANSLNVLANITLADIRKMAAAGDVSQILEQHYNHIGGMLNSFMEKVETVLQDWAALDAAERRGE